MSQGLNRLSFFMKNLLLSSVNILIIGILLTVSSYFMQGKLMLDSLYQQAFGVSHHVKSGLDVNDIKEALTVTNLDSSVQQRLTEHLSLLSQANKNVAQGYIFTAEIVDGKQTVVAMPAHLIEAGLKPGDLYENPITFQEATKVAVSTREPVKTNVYSDEFGTWISIVEPITDENGQVIAVFGLDMDASIVYNGQKELLKWATITLVSSLVLVLIIQYLALKRLLAPLRDLFEAISAISAGNLNISMHVRGKDELAQLSEKFNGMVQHLREIIKGVQQNADDTASSADDLSTNVERNTRALNQITQTLRAVASGADMQQQSAAESARAMQEMTIGIQRIAETSSIMAESSQDMAQEASQGDKAIQQVVSQMGSISKSVNHSANVVRLLDGRSQEIVQIVEVISGIAAQTNLLALNAAIEAARAGEQGRGFAVVADEVRKLAEQSQRSATQISTLIKEIQDETTDAVEAMYEGTKEVELGMSIAQETGKKFKSILDTTQYVADQIREVSAVAQQMSAGSEQVTASVQELSNIAKRSSKEVAVVATSTEEQLAFMEANRRATAKLNEMAQELRELIGTFRV